MNDTIKAAELVKQAKICANCQNRGDLEQFLSDLCLLLRQVFAERSESLREEEFIEKQTCLQYIIFALSIVTEDQKLGIEEVLELLRTIFTALCAIEDDELAISFDTILRVIVKSARKLTQEDYDEALAKLLEVLDSPTIFKKSRIIDNIIASLPFSTLATSSVIPKFWPHCRALLINYEKWKNSEILENCLHCGLRELERKIASDSVVEQAQFIGELFETLLEISSRRNELRDVIRKIFRVIEQFFEDNGKVLILKKELRESTISWMTAYMSLTGDSDDFGLLPTFSRWMVELTDNQEVQEVPAALCVEPIEQCVARIKQSVTSPAPEFLADYFDIMASLFKLSKVHDESKWTWISAEIQKHAFIENPRWPRLLAALLSVQHSICHAFFKKFIPSVDAIWTKIKADGSASRHIYSVVFTLSTCPEVDEGGKTIIPILLLPCFHDFRERVGTKRDNFRLNTSGRGPPMELRDLEKYAQTLEYRSSESLKLRAVNCALLIEKKTGHFVTLVAEMTISVFAKSHSNHITHCLPSLLIFLAENSQYDNDFLDCLLTKLCENQESYSEKTIIELCKTVAKIICSSASRTKQCAKCEKNQKMFVEPESNPNIKLEERSLTLFVKMFIENQQRYSEKVFGSFLEMCRGILIHVDSPRLPSIFTPVVKSLNLAFTPMAGLHFRIWELISWRNTADDKKKLQIYIPMLTRTLSSNIDPKELNIFMERVHKANLSKIAKVTVLSAMFADSAIKDDWCVIFNWISPFVRQNIDEHGNRSEQENIQAFFKRHTMIFTRCFLSRLFFDVSCTEELFNESKTRETIRSFVINIMIHFKFPNFISVLLFLRPTLLYWVLVSGARGQNHKLVCSIVDFLSQELCVASTSAAHHPMGSTDVQSLMTQRKTLITEMFQHLVQFSAFETCTGHKEVWSFCADHCGFTELDMKTAISSYRKAVFERLLLVTPQEFVYPSEGSFVVTELQKTYENLKKGEKFTLATGMDTRKEGIEFLFTFRLYFTDDEHFWMRERSVESFRVVLQNVKQEFLDTHWWIILATLRHSPSHLEATKLAWIQFVEQVHFSILRTNIWRIMTDLERVDDNGQVIECIWNRLKYANDIEKIANDNTMRRIFWLIPLEVEKKVDLDFTMGKSRRIFDVFEFIRQFSRYPSLLFSDNLCSKIDRGTIWKDDLPKLMGAITGILPACQSDRQRNRICTILQKMPICNSELADQGFTRWESTLNFFAEPTQLTQAVLEECAIVVETMSAAGKMKFADRTMCELQKFFAENNVDPERRSSLSGLRDMYSTMNCYRKPEPQMIETKSIDELSMNAQSDSWLTVLIVKCAEIAGESATLGLIPIAHIDDLRFLAKLAMRFILAVIHAGRDSVSQWILTTFEDALLSATRRRITKCERTPPAFIFYVFDFLYHYINTEEVRKKRAVWEKLHQFWKSMLDWMVKDEHGHMQPLIVKTAMLFGMEKRCILWMEFYMDQLRNKNKKEDKLEGEVETSYYFTLMNLYARIHELNGVRGSYARLSKAHIGHVYGKISMQEALGDVASAATLSAMTGKGKPFDPRESIRKLIDEHNSLEEYPKDKQIEYEEHIKSLKNLSNWMQNDKDFGPSPQVFAKTIEPRAIESTILKMIQDGEVDCVVNDAIEKAKMKTIERLSECGLGGSCSFETTSSLIAQVHQLDEISRFKDASVESLTRAESEFWKSIQRRTDDGEQRMDFLEPILRVRKSMLTIRMKPLGDMQKNLLRSKIVEVHLQSARIARLSGCQERAQLAIINAKKVLPFDNRIVLEEAKLQLQTSDELSGMNLLDSIIDKTFGELSKHYGDTQQSRNLDLQRTAKSMIDLFPTETKNLFSSVQMLRISQMIKAGNTIGFEKIYNDTMNLLNSFVSSGVMYEAAWLLDYLFHYNERNRHVLPLLKAYKEVAKFETNHVLQARAVERMMSLWLSNTRKMSGLISSGKASAGAKAEMMVNIKDMNREISNAHERIGLRAFYHAYAVLVRHLDHQDEDVFRTIKGIMQQLIFRMPHQCMWQSVYLLRQDIAEVKNRYMEVLTNVKRKAPCFTTLIDQYDYASAVFNAVPGKVDSDQCKLSTKVEGLKTLFREKKYDPKELIIDRRIDGECKIIGGIMVPIRSEIDGSVHDISLPEGFEESCLVPDRYLIHDFSDKVKVLHSKTKPVLIELITKAGRKVRLICKKEDDLTKDYHFTKMVEMCNDLLIKDEQTRIQSMAATTYSVIPLAKHGGIIEFMEGVTSFYETIDKHMTKSPSEWNQQVQKWATQMKTLSKDKKVEFFRNEMCEKSPLVMSKWFRCEYPEAGKWFASRKLFAKSSAVMSIIGYIFGLGDRHTKNLMVHVPTGKCVHVDFDMIFNKGELLSVPEVVPFRLTRNMVNGMGEVALDGEFRAVCEQTLRVFRENSYEIEKYIADLPNLVSDFNLKDFDMTEAKRLISGRLRGQIMTAKLYRGNPILHPMQVSQLASSLIELATSDEKLCEMFEGWMPTM